MLRPGKIVRYDGPGEPSLFRCGMHQSEDDLQDEAVRFLAAYHEALMAARFGRYGYPRSTQCTGKHGRHSGMSAPIGG